MGRCNRKILTTEGEVLVDNDGGEVLVGNDRGEVLVGNDGGEVLVGNDGGEVLVGNDGGEVLVPRVPSYAPHALPGINALPEPRLCLELLGNV